MHSIGSPSLGQPPPDEEDEQRRLVLEEYRRNNALLAQYRTIRAQHAGAAGSPAPAADPAPREPPSPPLGTVAWYEKIWQSL